MAKLKTREITIIEEKGAFSIFNPGKSKQKYDFEGLSALRKIISKIILRQRHYYRHCFINTRQRYFCSWCHIIFRYLNSTNSPKTLTSKAFGEKGPHSLSFKKQMFFERKGMGGIF